MSKAFKKEEGGWATYAPSRLQAAFSVPMPINKTLLGRMELVIGKLGAGKTTWAALRAKRLAKVTGRKLYTTGVGWPDEWESIASFEQMDAVRNGVFLWDELHLMLPSSKGLLTKEHERFFIDWLSDCRKRHVDVVGTTQAWTRCATHFRQLVTTVWIPEPRNLGVLHVARGFESPDDGGKQVSTPQWFGPPAARIPTDATVWKGFDLEDDEQAEGLPSPSSPEWMPPIDQDHH